MTGAVWGQGAKSVIGSLWTISDIGTSAAMLAFYHILSERDLPIAKLLQEAQIAMIEGRVTYQDEIVGSQGIISYTFLNEFNQNETITKAVPALPTSSLRHPKFWAPLQLIGSGH